MGLQWQDHHGLTVAVPWPYGGSTMALRWRYHGLTVAVPWPYCGSTVALRWQYRGLTVAVPWPYGGSTVALLWQYHGLTVAVSWPYCGSACKTQNRGSNNKVQIKLYVYSEIFDAEILKYAEVITRLILPESILFKM